MRSAVILTSVCAVLALPSAIHADGHAEDLEALIEAIQLDGNIAQMRAEGIGYGEDLALEMFAPSAEAISPQWRAAVDSLNNASDIREIFVEELAGSLADTDISAMLEWFESDLGASIVDLELSARIAMMDDDIEEANRAAAALARIDDPDRIEQIAELIDVWDAVGNNVAIILNANVAFMQGLSAGQMPESELLSLVLNQEPEIRSETTEWIVSYLYAAYGPLSDEDLDAYIAFFDSEAGRTFNTVTFRAFEEINIQISRGLGIAAFEEMMVQDL